MTLDGEVLLEQLEKAPHLERLSLANVSFNRSDTLQGFIKLHHLKQLMVSYPEKSKEFRAIKVVPGCQLISQDDGRCTWYDWTQENPDVAGLW